MICYPVNQKTEMHMPFLNEAAFLLAIVLLFTTKLPSPVYCKQYQPHKEHFDCLICSDEMPNSSWKNLINVNQNWSENMERRLSLWKFELNQKLKGSLRFISASSGCGRLKNRVLFADNGEKYCAKYRDNIEQLQGEAYSSTLAELLMIENVPPLLIIPVKPYETTWKEIWKNLQSAGWRSGAIIILTLWIDELQLVTAPSYLLKTTEKDPVLGCNVTLHLKSKDDVYFMTQWTDMVLLDFLTGNLDRLVCHQYNLQWDKYSWLQPIHNLRRTNSGILVFLDNESGFSHSYRLSGQYQDYHNKILNQTCLIKKRTFERLQDIQKISKLNLETLLYTSIPNSSLLPRLMESDVEMLKHRINLAHKYLTANCGFA